MREGQPITPKQNGYTLLTMMMALAVLTVLAALVSNMATASFNHHQYETSDRHDIWLFFSQIQDEITPSDKFENQGNEISFVLNGDTIDYKLVGTTIRRQLNGSGYEIALQNIQNANFLNSDQSITIELTDVNGRFYRWTIKKMIK